MVKSGWKNLGISHYNFETPLIHIRVTFFSYTQNLYKSTRKFIIDSKIHLKLDDH